MGCSARADKPTLRRRSRHATSIIGQVNSYYPQPGAVGGTAVPRNPLSAMALVDDIQMVRQHVRLGERHIAQQRARIIDLERLRAPVHQASEFLDLLESTQVMHHSHLERLMERARIRTMSVLNPEAGSR